MKALRSIGAVCLAIALCVAAAITNIAKAAERDDNAAAVGAALEVIAAKPAAVDRRVVVVIDDGIPPLTGLRAFGTDALVRTRAEARAEQRAEFVYLRSFTPTPDGLKLIYSQPASGWSGSLLLTEVGAAWTVKSHTRDHSSSGARYFYGELYDGVKCRDGTEMATRWNQYIEFGKAILAHAPHPTGAISGRCPGVEFPEVAQYRSMKRD